MHECYAMQILEKKQRKQKQQRGMVTKNREIKHKDHVRMSLFRCNSCIGVNIHIRMLSNSRIGIKV